MRSALIFPVLALLITCYGALLRLDAFAGKYGAIDHPAWARVVTHTIAPKASVLRPSSVEWRRETKPYVGGDPINYLRFAREMTSFYQAHVREPVFLALTRAWLWALDGHDVAVSFASLTGSILAIFGTYLVGTALRSPPVGLLAAFLVAIEYEVITWAPDGWRDDTFTATVLFAAWSLIRLHQKPCTMNAVLAGGLCGIACLTRLTALSFAVPALVWIMVAGAERRQTARYAALALGVLALLIAPFLINCAIATGDPFFAVNYHTSYYRHAEGREFTEPMSAMEYVRTKAYERPVATLDTVLDGFFVEPFMTKWRGFNPWLEGLGLVLGTLAVGGLIAMAFSTRGRILLMLLLLSLAPYVLTWNVGAREWRFTMHAYPFYIVAAACLLVAAAHVARRFIADRRISAHASLAQAKRVGAVAAVALVATAGFLALPWFVVREALAKGDSTSIETGGRDFVFYRKGWSPSQRDGVTVRVSRGERSVVHVPLPVRRDYDIVLRMDGIDPAVQHRVGVLVNGHLVARPHLTWDPARVGAYRVRVQAHMVSPASELTIVPEDRLRVRLWYVRVVPIP